MINKKQAQNKKQQNPSQSNHIQIILNKQSLIPISPQVNLLTSLQSYIIKSHKLSQLYLQNNLHFIMSPTSIITHKQSLQLIFNANNKGYTELKRYLLNIDDISTEILNNISMQVIQFFMILLERRLYLKIGIENIYMIKVYGDKVNITIKAIEEVSSEKDNNCEEKFIQQLQSILKKLKYQKVPKNRMQLEQAYVEYFKKIKIGKIQQNHTLMEQLLKNQKLLNELSLQDKDKGKAQKTKEEETNQKQIIGIQQIEWLFRELQMKYNGHYQYYQSSKDNFEPRRLWESLTQNIGGKDKIEQLIVLEIHPKNSSKRLLVGYLSSIFNSNTAKQLVKKPQKFGSYLTESQKNSSILISFTHKTIHRLNDPAYAFGHDPLNNILLCIGKCDIILSRGNVTNLCYFPTSYSIDSESIVKDCNDLCGGRQFELNDLYVYRFKK